MPEPQNIRSQALQRYLDRHLQPCRILLDPDGKVSAAAGPLANFGIEEIHAGADACDALPVLHGLDLGTAAELPMVAMPTGRRAHVVITPSATNVEVLLLDTTTAWEQQRELQQKANDLSLASEQRERLLRELAEAHEAVTSSRDAAEEASRLKSEFIARMSHEFRTPLAAMAAYTKRMEAGDTAAAAPVARATMHLMNLVDNLLDEAQLRAGKILIRRRPTLVAAVLQDVCDNFYPLAADKGLHFAPGDPTTLPAWLELDELRLRQVLINIIANAVKYSERGSITVNSEWADDVLSITVTDEGPGIAAAAQDKIFGAFWRESDSAPGAGLGLSISRSLMALMGGTLALDSEPGRGTTVVLSLPAARGETAPAVGPANILLVDDNSDVVTLLEAAFADAGWALVSCRTGAAAMDQVVAGTPDLVIVDRNLPDTNGFQFVRALRAAGFGGPVVMLTASNLATDADTALAAGCNEFIVKSAGTVALLDGVQRLLGKSGATCG